MSSKCMLKKCHHRISQGRDFFKSGIPAHSLSLLFFSCFHDWIIQAYSLTKKSNREEIIITQLWAVVVDFVFDPKAEVKDLPLRDSSLGSLLWSDVCVVASKQFSSFSWLCHEDVTAFGGQQQQQQRPHHVTLTVLRQQNDEPVSYFLLHQARKGSRTNSFAFFSFGWTKSFSYIFMPPSRLKFNWINYYNMALIRVTRWKFGIACQKRLNCFVFGAELVKLLCCCIVCVCLVLLSLKWAMKRLS